MSDLFWRVIDIATNMLLGMAIWQLSKQRQEDRAWRNYWKCTCYFSARLRH
jgi:hypothetical protein